MTEKELSLLKTLHVLIVVYKLRRVTVISVLKKISISALKTSSLVSRLIKS